ncbi:MAG: ABC transporter ATP-binding protein [Alphaproteobacteria bacterium]|nr:ABC transporter ATP-binding protein [Alphaproteobacteria bacterium]
MASVELKGLGKRYGGAVAVEDVSLRVDHGQLICLLGPSGCGKTTTLRLIAGFIEPSAGEILVGGKVLSSPQRTVPPEGRNMSMIFQSYALWPHMTVAENVAYGLRIRKMDRATIAEKLTTILATTHLEALADRYPGELSGGQQQRVSLARAMVVEPETLLLDEPLSNLDANLREEMRFEIRRLHDRYRYTTVYVTHDQAEAMTTADRIVVMDRGRIEQVGTPQEIYDQPRSVFVARFIGGSNILTGKALDASRVEIAGSTVATIGRELRAGETVSVSVRQHEVELVDGAAAGASNVLHGVVSRSIFLGASRDYTVALKDGTEIRVVAPPHREIGPGADVWLRLPADRCRALMGGQEA